MDPLSSRVLDPDAVQISFLKDKIRYDLGQLQL
jgi:hypothetical protein